MTEFLKNHPIALRHCLLYQFLRGESFEDFREAIGSDIINKEEFEFCFDQFKQGKFDDNSKPLADMREILRNDKKALRACILYESLRSRQESFSTYQKFCELIGENVMGYREFDFLFYRFSSGEFMDLDFESDEDKKVYELIDMPIHIMENVVNYLDIYDRSALSQTSQSLRTFTRDQKTSLRIIELEVYDDRSRIRFDEDYHIKYKSVEEGCKKYIRAGNRKTRTPIQGMYHWKQTLLDFKSILKHPKLHVDTLKIVFEVGKKLKKKIIHENDLAEFETEFKSIPHEIHCKRFTVGGDFVKSFLNILPSLKPGYLRTISIRSDEKTDIEEEFMEMEQWKQVAYFNFNCHNATIPLHRLHHFRGRGLVVSKKSWSVEELRQIKEILQKSPDLNRCAFLSLSLFDVSIVGQEFGDAVPGTTNIFHYLIPNSAEYFEIEVTMRRICISRKNI
ncbi:unnamed protein product [Caenorhabditis brenneri]